MQLATVVTINDLGHMTGIVESVRVYDDMTVYGVRTLDGMLYARTADELGAPSQPALLSFVGDLRILAAAHAELRTAVDLLDADAMTYGLIVAAGRSGAAPQIRAWYVRHGLDKLPHLTAGDILAARDSDHKAALALVATARKLAGPEAEHVFDDPQLGVTARGFLHAATREAESPLDVMRRIGRETGQPVTLVEQAPAADRAPRTRRRNRLVINGEQIA